VLDILPDLVIQLGSLSGQFMVVVNGSRPIGSKNCCNGELIKSEELRENTVIFV